MERACLIVAAVATVTGAVADEVDRSNVDIRIGMGPSHIVGSPDPIFAEGLDGWEHTRETIDFYKFNWKQLEPEKHNQSRHKWATLTPGPFIRTMDRHGISYGSEFNQLYYVLAEDDIGKAAAKLVIEGHKPLTDVGGQISSLHVDGPFRVLCGLIYNPDKSREHIKKAFKRLSPQEAYQVMIDFIEEINRVWPNCKVGWTVNLPNWRYSKRFDWFDGADYSMKMGGLYFMDILEGFVQALREKDLELGFLEVDYPFGYYRKNKQNPDKFRDLQAWCARNRAPFYLVVNTPPKSGAKSFHDGVMAYIHRLHQDKVRPDLMLIQSWYKYPATHVPETEPYTSTYVALQAATKIKELYGNPKEQTTSRRPDSPIMQDLSDPKSLITEAFSRFTPPEVPFDPDGPWSHVYQDFSSHGGKRPQGGMTITHRPGGKLRIENYRSCPQGFRSYTFADLNCNNDLLRSPRDWTVETKVSKAPDAPAHLSSGLVKRAAIVNNVLTLQTAGNRRTLKLPGPTTCKWCLLDAVGRMATQGIEKVTFSLLDEYDELCPEQTIQFTGDAQVKTRAGMIDIKTYQHTGIATVPGVFYVDTAGRVLFYLGGMQLLSLTQATGGAK